MFIPLNIVERGRKSLICSDPHASDAIPLWHFPLDSQEGSQFLWAVEQYIYLQWDKHKP